MKLSILICIAIGLFGLVLNFKTPNPYYNPNKNHHTSTGFKNPYLKQGNQRKSFSDLFKMMAAERPNPKPQIEKNLSIDSMIQKINSNNNFITWVGHSTMLLHINGKTILTDPIFSDRCSPVQFLGPKRYSFPTIDIKSLPKIDLIVISHNHYDHLDKNSVKNLGKNPLTIWYVPLGLKKWFDRLNIKNVIELDWFEERKQDMWKLFVYHLNTGQNGVHLKVLILYGHHGFLKLEILNFGLREIQVIIKSSLRKLVTTMVHLT